MSDIKGLHRNYSEDAVEADEMMKQPTINKSMRNMPARPPRKGSLSRNMNGFDDNGNVIINTNNYLFFKYSAYIG